MGNYVELWTIDQDNYDARQVLRVTTDNSVGLC